MAVDDRTQPESVDQLDEFPDTGLDWARDDDHDPSRLTIFDPEGANVATAWVTVDSEIAISLDQTR